MVRWACLFFLCWGIVEGGSNKRPPLIILDAGHGGEERGTHGYGIDEKTLSLQTVLSVKRKLKAAGLRVLMTRASDRTLSLSMRASIANQTRGALFVSIHYNGHTHHTAHGVEVYFCAKGNQKQAKQSEKIAKSVLNGIIKRTGRTSRGVKSANFHVLRETKIPAILIEGGFLTNAEEAKWLQDKAHVEQIAEGIVAGILVHYSVKGER
ncbi:MAG: N-acetylmuramoyl-L-alanine amidase [Chlamydiota bacterium]|nr:N-acetylmuramoyl-L-alanine amidase [Chlamydiota bacterium]